MKICKTTERSALQVGVQQWQGLIAINYPARKFGITRHMTVSSWGFFPFATDHIADTLIIKADEAKKKCPSLMTVHVATCQYYPLLEPGQEMKRF
jgi:DNA polymerase eta